MNIVGSTTVTAAIDATVKTHGNQYGSGILVRAQDATQNGHMPAT